MTIGVLALQGAFIEHEGSLDKLGIENFEVRKKSDILKPHDGLIIPGGESTVMYRLLNDLDLLDPIREEIKTGMPVCGTCAGLILLAERIENEEEPGINTMHIEAKRNAYGRQLGSFETHGNFGSEGEVPMVFIRAPYITKASENVEVLAKVDGKIVAAREGNELVTAFHPELTDDLTVHKYFVDMIKKVKLKKTA